MAKGPRYSVKFRRRRQGKTDYKKRISLLRSGQPRLVIRKSNKYIICALVAYSQEGDRTISAVHSSALKRFGWVHSCKNIPAAYLTGLLLARKTSQKAAVLDVGLYSFTKKSKLCAALQGVLDGGISVPHSDQILPEQGRLRGEHIKQGIAADFEKVKSNILGKEKWLKKKVSPKKKSKKVRKK